MVDEGSSRQELLRAVGRFVEVASQISGVKRIALVGSLVTEKRNPKDADLLITVADTVDIDALAEAGRKLKGTMQGFGSGADIFLCSEAGAYLGRTCSYRECHPRMACRGGQCAQGTRICDDFDVVFLEGEMLVEPPLELWPVVVKRAKMPEDLERTLLR